MSDSEADRKHRSSPLDFEQKASEYFKVFRHKKEDHAIDIPHGNNNFTSSSNNCLSQQHGDGSAPHNSNSPRKQFDYLRRLKTFSSSEPAIEVVQPSGLSQSADELISPVKERVLKDDATAVLRTSNSALKRTFSAPDSSDKLSVQPQQYLQQDFQEQSEDVLRQRPAFDPSTRRQINFNKLKRYVDGRVLAFRHRKRVSSVERPAAVEPPQGSDQQPQQRMSTNLLVEVESDADSDTTGKGLRIALEAEEADDTNRKMRSDRIIYYSMEEGCVKANVFGDLSTSKSLQELLQTQYFWLDVTDPSREEMEVFSDVFNIHPLTVEDIETDSTREKFEMYKAYYYICYSAVDQDPQSITYMETLNFNLLVYANFVLSFHALPYKGVVSVVKRLELLKSYLKINTHWINYAVLDDITDQYQPMIEQIEQEVNDIDDKLFETPVEHQQDMLQRIANARNRVNSLQRLLVSKVEVIRALMKRLEGMAVASNNNLIAEPSTLYPAMLKDVCLYLGDVQDHVLTMEQILRHTDTTLDRCNANYLAKITIELGKAANANNDYVAALSALAAIAVPLNVITGLWGMNVRVPGMADYYDSLDWFYGIVVVIGVILAGFAYKVYQINRRRPNK